MKKLELKHFVLFLTFGGGIALLNFLTPCIADDWALAGAKGVSDILVRGYSHYFHTNGRVPAHLLAMFFLMIDKIFFNIANTLVYFLFTGLILFHSTYGVKLNKFQKNVCYILVHLVLFIFMPNWGQMFLWLDGACNYLWTGTIMLLYLIPFRCNFTDTRSFGRGMALETFLIGILAGWCNENTSGGTILLSVMLMTWIWKREKKLPLWSYTGLAGSLLGFTLMIFAPGNFIRSTYFKSSQSWYNKLISRFRILTNHYYEYYRYLLFALVIVIVLLLVLNVGKKKIAFVFMYLLVSLAVCYALVLTPVLDGRPFFGCTMFLTIAFIYAIALILKYCESSRILIYSYTGILGIIAAVNLCNGFIDITYYKVHSDRRERFVLEQKEYGMTNLVVNELAPEPSTKYNAAYGLSDVFNDPKGWTSVSYANSHGLESATAVSDEIFKKVFRDGDRKLINCRDIYEYLALLDNPDYTVIMAVNDDSSGAVDEEIVKLMQKLGLKTDLRENFRWSYLAVIDQGNVIDEQYENQLLNFYQGDIHGHSIEVESSGKIYNKGNHASIKIDGYEYARNSIGLNIVVFDNMLERVVDRVTFNTWQGLEAQR